MKIFVCLMYVNVMILLPTALFAQTGYVEVTAPGNRQLKLAVESPRNKNAKQAGETNPNL